MRTDETIRVALSSGIFVHHDAISSSVEHKLQVLSELEAAGLPVVTTVFTHGSDRDDPRIRRVDSVYQALRLKDFQEAHLHFFEFGIAYPLFNAVFLLARRVPLVGVYHNITPPHLVLDPEMRRTVERSFVQKHNLASLDHVSCDSEMNREDLLEFGIPADHLSVLPLPAGLQVGPERISAIVERGDRPVELLYVGRFVHSKGVLDLVEAVRRLADRGVNRFRVTLAGNVEHSSPEVIAQLRDAERSTPTCGLLRVMGTPSDSELTDLYGQADAVVLPSYHEGYCVPVVEALTMGCQVIASDAGNIPNVLAGLGQIVPAGDVNALANAIAVWVGRVLAHRSSGNGLLHPTAGGDMPDGEWRSRVRRQAEQYSFAAYRQGFLRLLHHAASLRPGEPPPWLTGALGAVA